MKTDLLDQIKIASPCHASWESMEGDERKRFCSECNKHVYNISSMSRREAEDLVGGDGVCVRFYRRADGRVLTEDCPLGLREKAARVRRRLSFAISSALSFAGAFAQTLHTSNAVQGRQAVAAEFTGVVGDPTGAVIPGANVTLSNERTQETLTATTDAAGRFRFKVPRGMYTLQAEMLGFVTFKKQAIGLTTAFRLDLRMDIGEITMGGPVGEAVVKPAELPRKLKD